MKKIYLLITLSFTTFIWVNAQDTIRAMHYNLLYYGVNFQSCNATTNDVAQKEQYLRTIVNYYKPDILSCNELGKHDSVVDRLLDSVFNYNGTNSFARAAIGNLSNSGIITMIYYNQDKLVLQSQYSIKTKYRDFVFHKFYYKAPDLSAWGDTAFINCISTHLKAGDTPQDILERKAMVDSLMKHLNTLNTSGNYLLLADLNFYGASESGFQALINHSNPNIRFYDPINQIGEWHENQAFRFYHTQSTRTSGNGCPSTGGMDDRFDFILASSPIVNGPHKHVKYIPNSYKTPGQDGQRFNGSLINPVNYSAPSSIITAMYELSDHLPVLLDLQVGLNVGITELSEEHRLWIQVQNPVLNRQVEMQIYSENEDIANIKIHSVTGTLVMESSSSLHQGTNNIGISVSSLAQGVYLLNVNSTKKHSNVLRIIIP